MLITNVPLFTGGSGSNKGEFIYEMICASWMNYRNEQQYECQQDCQKKLVKEQTDLEVGSKSKEHLKAAGNVATASLGKESTAKDLTGKDSTSKESPVKESPSKQADQTGKTEQTVPHIAFTSQTKSQTDDQRYSVSGEQHHRIWNSSNRSSFSNISIRYQDNLNFVYSYIDIERLILDNLKARIRELGEHGTVGYEEVFASNNNLDEAAFDRKIERKKIDPTTNRDEKMPPKTGKPNEQQKIELNRQTDQANADQEILAGGDKLLDKLSERSDHDRSRNSSIVDLHSSDLKSSDKSERNEKSEKNDKGVHGSKNSQMHSLTKEFKKHSKRKKSTRNSYWAEFLTACEEDFEYNQSKINTNYNSRKLKECMFVYANCVTNNWVFSLIEKEIEKRNASLKERFRKLIRSERSMEEEEEASDEEVRVRRDLLVKQDSRNRNYVLPETIYIINLVPNQINIFHSCLFLQQSPNLGSFSVNFIAINLIRGDLRKKDLDSVIISHSLQDELNFNYMNYFRSINRLTEVELNQKKQKIRIRVTRNKQAIKMCTETDVQVLFGALENNQEIDLSEFGQKRERKGSTTKKAAFDETERGNLLFLLDDVVDIGDLLLCIEDRSLEMSKLRKFIQAYLRQKDKLSFNRLYS